MHLPGGDESGLESVTMLATENVECNVCNVAE